MRDSGLTHILSILGLHMAIMAGTVFWLVRALLALVSGLALRYGRRPPRSPPQPSISRSGAAVPMVRSWIKMSIVLIAVMLDRPALTMRNVALAALATSLWARASRSGPKRSPPRAGRGPGRRSAPSSRQGPRRTRQWDDDGRQDGANEGPRSSGNRILVAADQPDEAPLHAHAVGAEDAGLVGGICRFERNGVAPAP